MTQATTPTVVLVHGAFADIQGVPRGGVETKPAWSLVSTSDHTITPDVERFGYKRAGMTMVEVDSSHLVMLAHPKRVTDLMREAVRAIS
ncbi:hypothetical protein GCM10011579_082050 [Streptomyces albiflavescens]|uniref:Uncharacterized protein n=1 Tax=Streptomyces albiflavescens TaxID=1623582 RepID=A0A918D9V9_9ACTN|nr:hypothetical protein [Streptomyces albiflavescens]GGN88357.1 hypothetical protein GCM10011579_082050 [Streptomyces albiflavescens]